ncbi:MAG: BlaI/MecI/CopY family transcriptional regulator [Clostridiales bacterium]|nr:BlaI/MecI/CopY family transcriptional regulator [Clostridiales bacterium]
MNTEFNLSNADYRLLSIIWDAEPIPSPKLCQLAETELGWKRTTTYTVLRRLCDKGFTQNEDTIVTSIVKREEVQRLESHRILKESFEGSLPKFIAAFLDGGEISKKEAEKIVNMIEKYRGRE